eukprot:5775987-Pyramimonas_sp.AAC.1
MAKQRHLCSSNSTHSPQSHATLHLGHTFEQCEHTGLRQGTPGLRALPGHRFSARGGHLSPAFQQLFLIEKLLVVLCDENRGDSRALNALELERRALGAFLCPLLEAGVCCSLVLTPAW